MGSTTDFIAAIELGSSKITGIAGQKNSDGSIKVLAYASEESSSFIRKGTVYNLDKTAQSLTAIINKLEAALDASISKVYVGIGGHSLHTEKNTVGRNLKEEAIISQELVDSICDENLNTPLIDKVILHVAPQEYKIDNNYQTDPVGVAASRIEGRYLNIVARASIKKNLEKSFNQAKIEMADITVSPLAMANVVLSDTEKRSGCALVDMGADTTTISVYKNNILRFLAVLPLGGNSITHDIASLQMEECEAERLKKQYGDALYSEEEGNDAKASVQLEDGRNIELGELNDIIEARAEEIIANVWNQIQLSGFDDKLLAGIVITGGGSNLRNIDELLRKKSKINKLRTARFIRNSVLAPDEIIMNDGTQTTILGLLYAGEENCRQQEAPKPRPEEPPVQGNMFEEDEELLKQEEKAKEEKKKREEDEKRRKDEEKRRKQEEKKNKPSWLKNTIDKFSNEFFSDEDMK